MAYIVEVSFNTVGEGIGKKIKDLPPLTDG
jgi:hypothetical protein